MQPKPMQSAQIVPNDAVAAGRSKEETMLDIMQITYRDADDARASAMRVTIRSDNRQRNDRRTRNLARADLLLLLQAVSA